MKPGIERLRDVPVRPSLFRDSVAGRTVHLLYKNPDAIHRKQLTRQLAKKRDMMINFVRDSLARPTSVAVLAMSVLSLARFKSRRMTTGRRSDAPIAMSGVFFPDCCVPHKTDDGDAQGKSCRGMMIDGLIFASCRRRIFGHGSWYRVSAAPTETLHAA